MELLKNEVYDKIYTMLMEGRIESGKTYSLNKIAEELHVSRTPVRDAVIQLSNESQLDILPSRGFCLHRMTPEEIEVRRHFSIAAEGYCILLLARSDRGDREEALIHRLCALTEQMEEADLEALPFHTFFEFDNGFHNTLLQGAGEAFAEQFHLKNIGFVDHPELHMGLPLDRQKICTFHRRIVDAILSGNGEAGYGALLEHAEYMVELSSQTLEEKSPD